MEDRIKTKVLHEICLCCVHKPLKIFTYRDSGIATHEGTGCYEGLEGDDYCTLALKAYDEIAYIMNNR